MLHSSLLLHAYHMYITSINVSADQLYPFAKISRLSVVFVQTIRMGVCNRNGKNLLQENFPFRSIRLHGAESLPGVVSLPMVREIPFLLFMVPDHFSLPSYWIQPSP
jgi:hypothetical protein